jgi:hypothetical protein
MSKKKSQCPDVSASTEQHARVQIVLTSLKLQRLLTESDEADLLSPTCGHEKYRWYLVRRLVPLLLLCLLLILTACNGLIPSGKPVTQYQGSQEVPINAPHRPYKTIVVGLDITGSYQHRFFDQAKVALADAIDRYVQPNEDGLVVYVAFIRNNSYSDDSVALVIQVPPLPADPSPPVLRPMPTPTGDPYKDAAAQNQVKQANAQVLAAYQQTLRTLHRRLADVRAQVHKQTDQLRHLVASVDAAGTDEFGFFERASQRLQAAPGDKLLIAVTDLFNTTTQEYTDGGINLQGVNVKILWHSCPSVAADCASNDVFWQHVFKEARAVSVEMDDPAQSLTLAEPLS